MTLEKLEALVSVMTNQEYERFQSAVLRLVNKDGIFSSQEIAMMEKKIQKRKTKENSPALPAYSFSIATVPVN